MDMNKPINPSSTDKLRDELPIPPASSVAGSGASGGRERRPEADPATRATDAAGRAADTAVRAGKEVWNRGADAYDSTKQVVSNAYDKTSESLSQTYGQAMTYGRDNPGKLTLIAFGAGIGIGILLASAAPRRSRASRYAEPVVTTLSEIALDFFRHR